MGRLKVATGRWADPDLFISDDEIPVFMFHRVLREPSTRGEFDRSIYVTERKFEKIILLIKQRFHVFCLKELLDNKGFPREKCCIITFDDGWLDNYDVAFPILRKHRVPATIFLTTGMIGTSKRFWFDRLADLIRSQSGDIEPLLCLIEGGIPNLNNTVLKGSLDEIYLRMCAMLKNMSPGEVDRLLDVLEMQFGLSKEDAGRVTLNWEEIEEMSSSNISFACHGVNHSIFTRLDYLQKKQEMVQSRYDLLGKNVNFVNCLSFPNGNYDQETLDLATAAGYSLFFSASIDRCGEGDSSLLVHRICVSELNAEKEVFFLSLLKAKLKRRLATKKNIVQLFSASSSNQ